MSGTDFYYEPQVRLAEELASHRADRRRRPDVLRQLGHRGDRSGDQAVALPHEAAGRHRVPRRVPRPLARRAVADREQGDPAARLRAAACRASTTRRTRTPTASTAAPTRAPRRRCRSSRDQIFVHLVAPDEVAAIVVEPIQGEGGYIVPPHGVPAGAARADDAARHPAGASTKCSRAWAGRGRCSPPSTSALKATSSTSPRGSRRACRSASPARAADVMAWPPGAHASTFGGNPVVVRRRERDDQAAEGVARRQRGDGGGAPDGRHARAAGQASADRRRPRQGPDDRRSSWCKDRDDQGARRRGARTRSSRRCSAAACWCSAPAGTRSGLRRRWC